MHASSIFLTGVFTRAHFFGNDADDGTGQCATAEKMTLNHVHASERTLFVFKTAALCFDHQKTHLRYDVTGMRMEAPGNRTPSMMSSGSLRGNLIEDDAICVGLLWLRFPQVRREPNIRTTLKSLPLEVQRVVKEERTITSRA